MSEVRPIAYDDIPELAQIFYERLTGQHPARISLEEQQKWVNALKWFLTVLEGGHHIVIRGADEGDGS
jgi:hypothetical protein